KTSFGPVLNEGFTMTEIAAAARVKNEVQHITTAEQELAEAERVLAQIEERREVLTAEHGDAVSARRKLLTSGTTDLKVLAKADDRVAAVENSMVGVDDALIAQRGAVARLREQVADLH